MKRAFPGYYRPDETEFGQLWARATFALDANVLLNVYGYSQQTRETLIGLLDRVRDRLWIPHQFASEFLRNRPRAIMEQVQHYRSIGSTLRTILDQNFRAQHRHPFITAPALEAFERLCDELRAGEETHQKLLTSDPYLERLSALFDGRVGTPYSQERIQAVHQEARQRYEGSVPPGFLDYGKKPEPDAFADYIGWRQLLDHCAITKMPAILVTDDRKADWWLIHAERTLGPRPELVAEYLQTCESRFYMYSLEQFLVRAQEHLGQPVTAAVLDEVRQRSEERISATTDVKQTVSVVTDPVKASEAESTQKPLPEEDVKAAPGPKTE